MPGHNLLSLTLIVALVSRTHCQNRELIAVPFFRQCPNFAYDAFYDLANNVTRPTSPYVTEFVHFSGSGCAKLGVLKLELSSLPPRRRVLVDIFMQDPTGWVFNLGDSSTNNGYAGDAGTQSWDAEVQGTGNNFTGYLNDYGGSVQAFHIVNLYSSRLTLVVGNGFILWLPDNNNLINYYYSPHLFGLNGQSDTMGTPNYDLYLGLNRVIGTSFRRGTGVCKVGIKFLPEF